MILLARHGSHADVGTILSGRSEIALSATGHDECARLARRLAGLPLAAVHSSPRRRAVETASAVARSQGLAVQIFDDLDEIDFGDWTGQSFCALASRGDWRAWNAHRGEASTPNGDTMSAVTSRALRHFELNAGETFGENRPLLCVSHCDVIRGIVAHLLGLDADRLLAFDVDPCSLTTIDLEQRRVVAINERLS